MAHGIPQNKKGSDLPPALLQDQHTWSEAMKKSHRFLFMATPPHLFFFNFPSKLLSFTSYLLPCLHVLEKPQTGGSQDDVTQAQSWQMLLFVTAHLFSSPSTIV